jgi:plasmid stabilization system protein ParE
LRLRWTEDASQDLIEIAGHSPRPAAAVIAAMEWMTKVGFSLGRQVDREIDERYWPVPPLGVFYHVEEDVLVVSAVIDNRRRREAW